MDKVIKIVDQTIENMFKVGAHYGYSKSRRHPSTKPFVYGTKNGVEIIDLEKTRDQLEAAKKFVEQVSKSGKQILLVSDKNESKHAIKNNALASGLPYVAGRWIGGTLTNWTEIRKRVQKYLDLQGQRERGDLGRYTKKERVLIDRQIRNLEEMFAGIVDLRGLPGALFVIDPKNEMIAVKEAQALKIPVVALASTDCDISQVDYPIVANDSARASVEYFIQEIVKVAK